MDSDRPAISPSRVKRLFDRAPRAADFVGREVAGRMLERLGYIKIQPLRVLDAGSGEGADQAALRTRFPDAQMLALDLSAKALARGHSAELAGAGMLARLFRPTRHTHRIAADFAALPLAPQSIDLIWSNLALQWHAEPHRVMPEWQRVLKVGGLVLFSTFGPDTLREVRQAFDAVSTHHPRSIAFTDMHDYGDMLVEAGFATPVMDMETITLTYADAAALWRDVRALGGNPLAGRQTGLLSRAAGARLAAALDAQRDAGGRYKLSFEVIYGHAWKAEPRKTADGRAVIRFERP